MDFRNLSVGYPEILCLTADIDDKNAALIPKSLQILCIQTIANHIDKLIDSEVECSNNTDSKKISSTILSYFSLHTNEASSGSIPSSRCTKSHFKQNICLSSTNAALLLSELFSTRDLNKSLLSLFHKCNMNMPICLSLDMKKSCSYNVSSIFSIDWTFFFTLKSLTLRNFHEINQSLWNHKFNNLLHINFSGVKLLPFTTANLTDRFPQTLFSLDLSYTSVNDQMLKAIVRHLHQLKRLNIASTEIHDIECLHKIADSLESLNVHKLQFQPPNSGFLVIVKSLSNLRELYFSWSPEDFFNVNSIPSEEILERFISNCSLQRLEILDLSGNRIGFNSDQLRRFLANHPKLRALAISSWIQPRQHMDGTLELIYKEYSHLKIAGDSKETLIETLRWHQNQPALLQPAMHMIFDYTQAEENSDLTLLQEVIACMGRYNKANQPNLILAATAVVYNLTRGLQACRHPQYLLNWAVSATLQAIENHLDHRQMMKNCFLTLCTDYVLHKAQFSYLKCCELVFAGLLTQDDHHLKRMGVAILSILAADLNQTELYSLTCQNDKHFKKLLQFVAEKCLSNEDVTASSCSYLHSIATPNRSNQHPQYDLILRFTLSALWNFTDECMPACNMFIACDGLYVYERVFENMKNIDSESRIDVYTKCLGLLNNTAEFEQCRSYLFRPILMRKLHEMLTIDNIQASYFAAGILAHLALCESDWLKVPEFDLKKTLSLIIGTILQWKAPEVDMVAYRSLKNFERLATDSRTSEAAQVWVLWAIFHLISRKKERYIPLLQNCCALYEFIKITANRKLSNVHHQEEMISLAKKIIALCLNSSTP